MSLLPICRASLVVLGALLAHTATLPAQERGHDHAATSSSSSSSSIALPDRARRQIHELHEAVTPLSDTDAATDAGFFPVLGWIPSMGTHWVNMERMEDGFDRLKPDHLMFSPIDGELKLVGAAYAFRGARRAKLPDAFAGSLDRWHDHPWLAPEGETIHMLHVWFVDSPDGPFAGHNPWLPFWAVGLTPPDESRMRDPATARRIRALGSALSTTVEPGTTDLILQRVAGDGVLQDVERHRMVIRDLVPGLKRAQAKGDLAEWDRLAERGAREWEAIRGRYLAAAPTPRARAIVAELLEQITGEGGGHH